MNEDFQSSEVRKYAESIYNWLASKLTSAIITKLELWETYTDAEGNSMPVEFDYAFKQLQAAGYTLNHTIIEKDWTATLSIKFYKLEDTIEYDIKTTYNISVTPK